MPEKLIKDFSKLEGQVGILGGSFDPVHLGHLGLAEVVQKKLGLAAIVFLPAAQNPLKANAPVATKEQRLSMLDLALKSAPDFYYSDIELKKEGVTFTIDTINQIIGQNSKLELYLIVGVDNINIFHKWKDFEKILSLVELVPVSRNKMKLTPNNIIPEEYVSKWQRNLIDFDSEISSTGIRANVKLRESWLPDEVGNYIKREKLYNV